VPRTGAHLGAARRRCRAPLPRAAEAMRRILIDNARKNQGDKRGGQQQRAPFHDNIAAPMKAIDDLLAIDEALTALAEEDAESVTLVKLRFYVGLYVKEAADVMGLPPASAYRTNYAKAWLRTKLGDMKICRVAILLLFDICLLTTIGRRVSFTQKTPGQAGSAHRFTGRWASVTQEEKWLAKCTQRSCCCSSFRI